MYKITKEFAFEAAHHLNGLPADHPCTRTHGHSYRVQVDIVGDIDKTGFVYDYRKLDPIKQWIDEHLDHQDLNLRIAFNPTAEIIARELYYQALDLIPELHVGLGNQFYLDAVRVSETQKTWAEYRP